jgi:hypothetical protein
LVVAPTEETLLGAFFDVEKPQGGRDRDGFGPSERNPGSGQTPEAPLPAARADGRTERPTGRAERVNRRRDRVARFGGRRGGEPVDLEGEENPGRTGRPATSQGVAGRTGPTCGARPRSRALRSPYPSTRGRFGGSRKVRSGGRFSRERRAHRSLEPRTGSRSRRRGGDLEAGNGQGATVSRRRGAARRRVQFFGGS